MVRSFDIRIVTDVDGAVHRGPHGWGRLSDEKELEEAAMQDEVDASDSEGSPIPLFKPSSDPD